MLEVILLALAPLAVNAMLQGIKTLRAIDLTANRKTLLRFSATICSFGAVLLGGLASGEMIDQNIIVTFVETVAVFFASQITYALAKKRESDMI